MSGQTTPVRYRPSLVPSSAASSSSSIAGLNGGVVSSGNERERKKRARNLLRDYYGLGPASKGDPMDIDSPASFNPELYFNHMSTTASLPELLKRENELLTEIRELDGERQSLVYNHHHELIDASDTIKKMKSRALTLDASLESLKTSFESISKLSSSLASASRRLPAPSSPTVVTTISATPVSPTVGTAAPSISVSQSNIPPFDPILHLSALLSLPILLRALLVPTVPPKGSSSSATATTTRDRSNSSATITDRDTSRTLWGVWEPALRSWEEAGVEGVEEVMKACRDSLRGNWRARAGSSGGSR